MSPPLGGGLDPGPPNPLDGQTPVLPRKPHLLASTLARVPQAKNEQIQAIFKQNLREFSQYISQPTYRKQLEEVKKTNDQQEYVNILHECATNISSELYGNLITYQEAMKKLHV